MPGSILFRDIWPSSALLRRTIHIRFGDIFEDEVSVAFFGSFCHIGAVLPPLRLVSHQDVSDVLTFFEHDLDVCFTNVGALTD